MTSNVAATLVGSLFSTFWELAVCSSGEVMPRLRRCAFAGEMVWRTQNELFTNNPIAADIFSDIMADRGFGVTHEVRAQVPDARET